jgi:hypothetical protein
VYGIFKCGGSCIFNRDGEDVDVFGCYNDKIMVRCTRYNIM